ncbi:MAG TPA: anti-sigma factor [Pyrinomonadaceae bacterium]|nr:anti-sigma factor [Pyrinomonadaceae bacterium]
MRGHEEYREMVAARALDALDAAEARELDAHLATCAECRAEWDAWQETAASLAYAAPAAEPSPGLRSRILASIRAEGAPQISRPAAKRGTELEEVKVKSSQAESNVLPFEKPARRSWSMASKIGALAASLALVALAISLVMLWNRYNAAQQELARVSAQLNQAQGELNRERETLAREREARELISAPDARIMTLAGTEMAKSAHAKFVFDRTTGRAMLMAYELPPAPSGKAYQLWFIKEGQPPMPGRVFSTDTSGHAEMSEQLPANAREATVFAVTLEPEGGTSAPTSKPYLLTPTS